MRTKNESGVDVEIKEGACYIEGMGCDFSSLEDWQADQQEYCIATANRGFGRTISSIIKQIEHVNVNSKIKEVKFGNEVLYQSLDLEEAGRVISAQIDGVIKAAELAKIREENIATACQITGQPYEKIEKFYDEMNKLLASGTESGDALRNVIEELG